MLRMPSLSLQKGTTMLQTAVLHNSQRVRFCLTRYLWHSPPPIAFSASLCYQYRLCHPVAMVMQ